MFSSVIALDAVIALALNRLAQDWPALSHAMAWLAGADAMKTTPFVVMAVACWHRAPLAANRVLLLRGLLGVLAAMALGRALPALLPFRARPLHEPALALATPPGVSPSALDGWTSFPSDHGMLFGALVALAFALDRRLGWLLGAFTALLVFLPRMLLGFHYATDILAGALVGLGCLWAALHLAPAGRAAGWALAQGQARPALFHVLVVLALMQLGAMFMPLRSMLAVMRATAG